MNGKRLGTRQLNARRRRAVELRHRGLTLAHVSEHTGLSAPTIISACKAFEAGGWDAVDVRPRGRRPGGGRLLQGDTALRIRAALLEQPPESAGADVALWDNAVVRDHIDSAFGIEVTERTVAGYLAEWGLAAPDLQALARHSTADPVRRWMGAEYASIADNARRDGARLFWAGERALPGGGHQLFAHDARGRLRWLVVAGPLTASRLIDFLSRLHRDAGRPIVTVYRGADIGRIDELQAWLAREAARVRLVQPPPDESPPASPTNTTAGRTRGPRARTERTPMTLTHLQRLEAESIHIMREVVAEAENPVMLYSIGKDSAVMLHLAMKAFHPAKPPFPLLHVDTTWKFQDMYRFRDRMASELGLELLVHVNQEGVAKGINPFTHGSAIHTDIMKTEALKQALDKYGFDAAFGGARRDEEKSRAKERIFSFRTAQHRWDPKNQRPELWKLYNARKHKSESMRVFPLSNWTELDIWQYIYLESIPIVPLYYSAERPVVMRDGTLIMVDDERMPLKPGEVPMMRNVRFRTLGCYPLTGAVESDAATLPEIIQEMLLTKTSERQGRVIDHDSAGSMEKKKQEGYF